MNQRTLENALAHAESQRHRKDIGEGLDCAEFDLVLLADEVKRLRQGLWECGGIAGDDQDGNKSPDHMTFPDIVVYAKRAVEELRRDHDEALDEIPLTPNR